MISAVLWIPKGAAKAEPDVVEMSDAEMAMLMEKNLSLRDNMPEGQVLPEVDELYEDSDEQDAADRDEPLPDAMEDEVPVMADSDAKAEDLLKQLNMDDYDNEDEGVTMFLGAQKMTILDAETDPYITVPEAIEHDDEAAQDVKISQNDALIIAAHTEEDNSSVEVYIFEEHNSNLYIHHDITLPSFPLSLCWMDVNPRIQEDQKLIDTKGSFLAVGSFSPEIEIWNLDVLDVMEPVGSLGGYVPADQLPKQKKKKGKKKKPKAVLKEGSHSKAVMSLSWSPHVRRRLASGSADTFIKLWDVPTQTCISTLTFHKDKVQSLEWHPVETQILLSGGYDKQVFLGDVRNSQKAFKFTVDADVEKVSWDPVHPNCYAVSTESGTVMYRDARNSKKPLWAIKAHEAPCTGFSFNHVVPHLMATCSLDTTVRLWDFSGGKPKSVVTRDLSAGRLFSVAFQKESPFILTAGGDKGKLAIWDVFENERIAQHYSAYSHLSIDHSVEKKQ